VKGTTVPETVLRRSADAPLRKVAVISMRRVKPQHKTLTMTTTTTTTTTDPPRRPPLNEAYRLTSQFVSLLCGGVDVASGIGRFLALIPARLGRRPALDAAARCLVDCWAALAYRASRAHALQLARSNLDAVRRIRAALNDAPCDGDVLLAVAVVMMVEVSASMNPFRSPHLSHAQ